MIFGFDLKASMEISNPGRVCKWQSKYAVFNGGGVPVKQGAIGSG